MSIASFAILPKPMWEVAWVYLRAGIPELWNRSARLAWIIMAACAVLLAVLSVAMGFHYAPYLLTAQFVILLAIAAALTGAGWLRPALIMEMAAILMATFLVVPPLCSVLAAFAMPLQDASLAEINPLNVSSNGTVTALDAKFNFDSNALFRHPEIVAYRDLDEEDPAEVEASKFDLAYISLDGNIGCLVNGAGLAMATMDTIKLFGGEPANFLDVGGGATTEKVTEAFKIMLKNPNLTAILVNIFGGIMRCDVIAEGVIAASKAVSLKVPLVVRMKGTNEDLGKKMLAESGLPIISADSMEEAAQKVVAAAAGK